MNIREYISSGILESYVMGELTAEQRAEVEKNLTLYPEIKNELEQIEEIQETLLMQAGVVPRPGVKASILKKIAAPDGRQRQMNADGSLRFWRLAAAASVSVAVIAGVLAYQYRQRWKESESNFLALTQQNARIAQDYNQVNDRLNKLQRDFGIMTDPQFRTIVMTGTPNAPDAMASVYWNESTREVYLRIRHLKELASGNQYQLWAIIDGKPVDAGVFDVSDGLLKMKNVDKGAVLFAVTVEPRGGNPSPTLETMQVKGEVEAG